MDQFRQRQSRIWRKRRKLVLQLLAFSTLYAVGWGPSTMISVIQTLSPLDLYMHTPNLYYINNSSYFVCPLPTIHMSFCIAGVIEIS